MRLSHFPATVFLTGATGVLGGRILTDLLQSTSARIYCLVRGRDAAHCRHRVESLLRVYHADPALGSRAHILNGDVTQEQLGLWADVYAELQGATELTIHAAANTSLLGKYQRLEPINVRGT